MTHTIEHLTKAFEAARFVSRDLLEALKTADVVAALVLYPLISDAADAFA